MNDIDVTININRETIRARAPATGEPPVSVGSLAANLRKLRETRKLSVYELSRQADVSKDVIWRYEHGIAKQPNPECLRKLAGFFGVSVRELAPDFQDAEDTADAAPGKPAGSRIHKAEYEPIKFGQDFGENVRMAREAAGLSKAELAAKSGISVDTISRYENGRIKSPTQASLHQLAAALDVAPYDLMPGCPEADGDGKPAAENEFGRMLGENIRKYREAAGMTMGELAERAGMAQSSISRYESGAMQRPCLMRLERIAMALDVTVNDLAPGYELMPRCALPPGSLLGCRQEAASPSAEQTAAASKAAQAPSDGHLWLTATAPDGTKARYFSGPLSELIRGMAPEDVKQVADYAKFVLGMPANDPAADTGLPGQWLGIASQDGAETHYYRGPLGDLLYGMTPENVRQVIDFSDYIRRKAGLQQTA